jgi:hypothetical protein
MVNELNAPCQYRSVGSGLRESGYFQTRSISKLGFSVEIKARPSVNPPRLTGSSTRILKYVEDLRRELNTDIGRKDFFEMLL